MTIHRDVKSSNILLSEKFEPQLSDFGLAMWGPKNSSFVTEDDVVGTFGYLAPEYFMYVKVSDKIDVYAFGVVLLELLSGRKSIGSEAPKGQDLSLVVWAKPVIESGDVRGILDPNLDGKYDEVQLRRMVLAATLCITRSARLRPKMIEVWNLGFLIALLLWTLYMDVSYVHQGLIPDPFDVLLVIQRRFRKHSNAWRTKEEELHVTWSPPTSPGVKINFDVPCRTGFSVIAVVCRNHEGEILQVRTATISVSQPLWGEIKAALLACIMADEGTWPLVELEGDSLNAYTTITHDDKDLKGYLVADSRACHDFMSLHPNWKLS